MGKRKELWDWLKDLSIGSECPQLKWFSSLFNINMQCATAFRLIHVTQSYIQLNKEKLISINNEGFLIFN